MLMVTFHLFETNLTKENNRIRPSVYRPACHLPEKGIVQSSLRLDAGAILGRRLSQMFFTISAEIGQGIEIHPVPQTVDVGDTLGIEEIHGA